MCIARYRTMPEGSYWMFTVELLVQTNGKLISIGSINCRDEAELEQATQWVDFVLKGE